MAKNSTSVPKPVTAAAKSAAGKAVGAVKRKLAGEHMCESCRTRVATHWSNRMHQCGHCFSPTFKAGGGRSWEPHNLPRGHHARASR